MSEFSRPVEGTAIEIGTAKAIAARIAFRVGTITASARMVGIAGHLINTTETDRPSNKSLYMCGRVIQTPVRFASPSSTVVSDSTMENVQPRYNAAPSQELLVIRENHKTGERSLDLIKWA
jgi:hypothetical protein